MLSWYVFLYFLFYINSTFILSNKADLFPCLTSKMKYCLPVSLFCILKSSIFISVKRNWFYTIELSSDYIAWMLLQAKTTQLLSYYVVSTCQPYLKFLLLLFHLAEFFWLWRRLFCYDRLIVVSVFLVG